MQLANVTRVSMSSQKDTYVVIHCRAPERDLVLDFGLSGENRVSELVTALYRQCYHVKNQAIGVDFSSSIRYNNARKNNNEGRDVQVEFAPDDGTRTKNSTSGSQYARGAKGTAVVYYR